MKSTSSRKNVLKIILIVLLSLILCAGAGVGIYFLVRDKNPGAGGPTQEQKDFGTSISESGNKLKEEELVFSSLEGKVELKDISDVSNDFVVSKSGSQVLIHKIEDGGVVSVEDEISEIVSIHNNLAVGVSAEKEVLINLSDGKTICSLEKVVYKFVGDHVVLFAYKGTSLQVSLGQSVLENSACYIINTNTLVSELSPVSVSGLIDYYIFENYMVLYTNQKSVAYSLTGEFKKVLELDNKEQEAGDVNYFGFVSNFSLDEFYRIYELSSKALFVNKIIRTQESQCEQIIDINGSDGYVNNEYFVYLVDSSTKIDMNDNGRVLKYQELDFGDKYIAITSSALENKKVISKVDRTITYYLIQDGEAQSLFQIVSYDHVKYGSVVGFKDDKLVMSGGTESATLDFNGATTSGLIENAVSISKVTNDMVVYTSISGMQGLVSTSGEILHSATYFEMSPILNSKTIAYDGGYFILSKDKTVVKIDNFAQEFRAYVLSGIGYYFIDNQNGTYDVLDFNQNVIYDNVSLTLNYNESSNIVLMSVNNEKLVKITPIDDTALLMWLEEQDMNSGINGFNNMEQGPNVEENVEIGEVKNAVNAKAYVSSLSGYTTITDDEITGMARLSLSKTINFEKDIIFSLSMDVLESWQKALLPEGVVASGAHFITYGEDDTYRIVIAIFKTYSGYVVVYGFKGVYLQSIKPGGYVYFNGSRTNNINLDRPWAPQYIDGGLTVDGGKVDWKSSSSLFDGGFVLSTTSTSLSVSNMIVKNAYYLDSGDTISESIHYSSTSAGYNDFTITRDDYSINIQAKPGLIISNAVVEVGGTIIGRNTSKSNKIRMLITDMSMYESSTFTISFRLTQAYCKIIIDNTDDYYGFSNYAGGGYPNFGFKNFNRIKSINITKKTGYTFKGCNKVDTGEDVLEINSSGKWKVQPYTTLTNLSTTYNYKSVYEANTYTVTFDTNNGTGTSLSAPVVYGEPMTVMPAPTKKGFSFSGWYYGKKQYQTGDICDIASDFTLVANWIPLELYISFDLNKSVFSNGNKVGNVEFNLDKLYFVSDYSIYDAGEEVSTIVRKKVNYNEAVGTLPVLIGYNASKQQEYIFMGWYRSSSGGTKVTETTTVTFESDITVYARYSRKLYSVAVTTSKNGDSYNSTGTSVMSAFSYLGYNGSNSTGTLYKSDFATNETGSAKWSATSGVYKAYGYQGDSMTFVITQNKGYYIDSIKYIQNDGLKETVIRGVWSSSSPNSYSLSYTNTTLFETNVEIGNAIKGDPDTIHLTINNLDKAATTDEHGLIEISYKAREFSTTITYDDCQVSRNSTTVASGDSFVTTYNQSHEFNLTPLKDAGGVQRSWLKSITINGTEYTFSDVHNREQTQTKVLTLLAYVVATYNATTGLYDNYRLVLQNQENYTISVNFEQLSNLNIVSKLGHTDLADGSSDGFTIDTNKLSNISFNYDWYDTSRYITYGTVHTQGNVVGIFGSNLEVTYISFSGYTFYDISLKDSSGAIITYKTREDVTGGFKYTYEISDRTKDYSMVIRSKAAKYTVVYEDNNVENDPNPATGSTPASTHYYNVWSNLSTNGYQKTGYTFLGYSKTKWTGNTLTTSDRNFTDGQLLNENLTSIDGDEVTLYTVFGVKTYTINYQVNDFSVQNGTTVATLPTGVTSVKFDNRFPSLKKPSRRGYTFNGWFTAASGGEQVEAAVTMFNISQYSKLEVDESTSSIKLYAQWTAIVYNVIIDVNDVNSSNGSSPAVGETSGYTVEFDKAGDFVLPMLSRAGYDFMGYKSVRLTSDQAKTDTRGYLGLGERAITTLNNIVLIKPIYNEISINDSTKEIRVYAVWIAKMMRAYVNLNYEYLKLPTDETGEIGLDGQFTIGSSLGTGYKTSYTEVYVEFEFDKNTNVTMPEIYPKGYEFTGYFLTKEFDPSGFVNYNHVYGTTIINYERFQKATFTDENGVSKSLAITDRVFSIYATYVYLKYEVSYAYENGSAQNPNVYMLGLNEYTTYDYSLVNASNHVSSGKVSGIEYGKDVVYDIMVQEGQYIPKIVVKYIHSVKGSQATAQELEFGWNSGDFTLSLNGSTLTQEFRKVDGYRLWAYQGLYIKVLDYNRNGTDAGNCVQNAVRVIIGFDFIKTDIHVEIGTTIQTFTMRYYRKIDATSSYNNQTYSKVVPYGYKIQESDLVYAYTPGYMFENYYYGTSSNVSSNLVGINDEVYDDTNIVARYGKSTIHSVIFYYWDGTKYVRNDEISDEYVLGSGTSSTWTKGTNTDYYSLDSGINAETGKPNGGFLTMIPTPSNDQWPLSQFAGYVISETTPSTYFNIRTNAKDLPRFDSTTLIEEELHVYPAFVDPYIQIASTGNRVSVNYEFYDIQTNGDAKKIDESEISYIWFTPLEYDYYLSNKTAYNNNKEAALGHTLGHDNYDSHAFSTVGNVGYSSFYVCAVIFRYNEEGQKYIYLVSENCLRWTGTSFSSEAF